MAKTYTTVSIPVSTRAKWDLCKERMYGDLHEEVSNERMMNDLLNEKLDDL